MYTEEQKINNRFAITIFITAVFICVAGLFFAAFQIVQQKGDLKPIYIGSAAMAGVITLIYFIFKDGSLCRLPELLAPAK